MEREEIHTISRHSNWKPKNIDKTLQQEVYNNTNAWKKFLKLFFITLGVGFTTAGIIFFFAYNWADLHKFVKIGLVESILLLTTFLAIFSKLNVDIKNILLTSAAVLVGVLFAVFGQIYQTGANAYDFFLGWTLFITLWVVVSNFAPLWLLFIVLINTTLVLYTEQVAHNWSVVFLYTLLFTINIAFLSLALFIKKSANSVKIPIWFTNTLALAAVTFSTLGISFGVFQPFQTSFFVLIIIATIFYAYGFTYGLKIKSGFLISIIAFSIIIIISAFLLNLFDESAMFFAVSLFIIGSVTFVIKNLLNLQKKWTK